MNLNLYRVGLSRVAKVINSNPTYDDILGEKLLKPGYDQIEWFGSEESTRKYVIDLFFREIKKNRLKRFDIPNDTKVVVWARSKNNLREIEFFSNVSKKYQFSEETVALDCCPIISIPSSLDSVVSSLTEEVKKYYESIGNVSKSLLYQHVQYTLAYLNFHITLSQSSGIRLVIVANDHSPIPVALSIVASELGISRLYIQHAEVTNSFPPLDFEFSILRNKQSFLTYKDIGPIKGRSQIIGRKQTTFDMKRLLLNTEELKAFLKIDITIYLTAIFELDKLLALIKGLHSNQVIGDILVKPHPSLVEDVRKSLRDTGIKLVNSIPQSRHLAVVGSSSIVTELLHLGIPVFQCFELDTVPEDYYGFVKKGLVGRVRIKEAKDCFWHSLTFDDRWLLEYSVFDPTVDYGDSDLVKFNELDFFTDLFFVIQGNDEFGYAQRKKSISFRRNLYFFTSTFLSLLGDNKDIGYPEDFCIAELEGLFAERDPRLNKLLGRIDSAHCTSSIAAWLILKKIEWNGHSPDRDDFEKLYNFVLSCKSEKKVAAKLEGSLLSVLIRLKHVDLLNEIWHRARHLKKEKLHINRRIALLRLLNEHKEIPDIDIDRATLFSGLSDFHRLKLEIQSGGAEGDSHDRLTHVQLEKKFIELTPANVSKNFIEHVRPCYEKYRARMAYMDVKVSVEECSDLRALIIRKISMQEPFSLVRLSDGEGYIFKKLAKFFSGADAKNRERHWWGEEIPEELAIELSDTLLRSLENADVLGIPSIYRFLRDHTDSTKSLDQSLTGRGLLEVLNGLIHLDLTDCIFAEDKVNLTLFSTKEKIGEFAKNAKRVVFIGSAVKESIEKLFNTTVPIVYIGIPTHFKTKNNEKYIGFTRPIPFLYKNILSEIDSIVDKGDVVFVAGGIIGKCFIDQAKIRGAVALDVGSALDELIDAGIHSLH